MRRTGPLFLAWMGVACERLEVVEVPLPPLPAEARTAFVTLTGGGQTRISALDLSRPGEVRLPHLFDSDAATVALLTYDRPFDAFPIAPGDLVPTRAEPWFGFPADGAFFSVAVEDGVLGEWRQATVLPPDLAALRFPGALRTPCTTFRQRNLALPGGARVASIARWGDDAVLIVTDEGPLYRVSRAEDYRLHPVDTGSVAVPRHLAHADPEGRIWLLGGLPYRGTRRFGAVVELDPDTLRFSEREEHPHLSEPGVVADVRGGPGGHLWVLGSRGDLARLERGAWKLLDERPGELRDWARGLGEADDGSILLVAHDATTAQVRDRSGAWRELELERLGDGLGAGLATAAAIAGVGVVVGSNAGDLYRFAPPARFERLPWRDEERPGLRVESLASYRDGRVLFGGQIGLFGEYVPGHGFCLGPPRTPGLSIVHLLAIGDDVVIEGEDSGELVWLEREG